MVSFLFAFWLMVVLSINEFIYLFVDKFQFKNNRTANTKVSVLLCVKCESEIACGAVSLDFCNV